MTPKRRDELIDGGSLYWVIRGVIQCRQRLIDIRPGRRREGVSRCALVSSRGWCTVEPGRRDPFQGWRYLKAAEAPPDLGAGDQATSAEMPLEMRRELAALGLL
jgi:hypothetical protein